jgi:hypothetical protein
LVLIAWLAPLLPALLLAFLAAGSFGPVLDRSLFSNVILEGNGFAAWVDLTTSSPNTVGPILSRGIVMFFLLSALFQILVSAGIVEALVRGEFPQPFLSGVRRNTWPFLRSGALAAVAMVIVLIVARLLIKLGSHLAVSAPDGRFQLLGIAAAGIAALVLFGPIDLAYDLSRIASVRWAERSMTRGLLRALGTVLKRPGLFVPLYLLFVMLPLVVSLVYAVVRTPWTPAGGAAILGLFILQQIVMVLRAFLRIAIWGAEVDAYRMLGEPRWCRKKAGGISLAWWRSKDEAGMPVRA